MQAMLAYERNELLLARQHSLEAIEALQLTGEPYNPAIRDVYLTLIRTAIAMGDIPTAQNRCDEGRQLMAATVTN